MPSGSHGGSSGSHRSGGSSFGGRNSYRSSSTHSGSRGSYMHMRGPVIYHHHSGGVYSFGQSLIAFIVPFIFLGITTIALLFGGFNNEEITKIQEDYYYYNQMIENAERHPEYIREAYITDIFYNDSCDKYYYTYKTKDTTSDTLKQLSGYTFSTFDRSILSKFHINETIQIATNSKILTSHTDSIPMEYRNISIEDDGEYIVAMNNKKTQIGLAIFFCLIEATIITIVVIKIKKHISAKNSNAENSSSDTTANNNYCLYCGSLLDNNSKSCKNCGASQTSKR